MRAQPEGTALLQMLISGVYLKVNSSTLEKINGKSCFLRMPSITSTNKQDVCFHSQGVAFNFPMLLCVCEGGCVAAVGGWGGGCLRLSEDV